MLSRNQRAAIEAIKDGRSVIYKCHFPQSIEVITTVDPAIIESTFERSDGSEYAAHFSWPNEEAHA